ncbi:MAG: helix-turn-helix domain-containing protein [Terrimicrobiaceae bacterium]
MKNHSVSSQRGTPRFINPHRLFHGVWLPQWLEERPEVSEKAKKLYAYLTYFAGGKGCSWPSFGLLAEKLHCSRRHVMRLVQELSTHRLITVTNVSNPERGHCANYYRFLWHPWMQNERDASFVLAAPEREPLDTLEESPDTCQPEATLDDIGVTSPLVTSQPPAPGEIWVTSPGDILVTTLVTPMSPQENNKKRINYRGKVPATSWSNSPSKAPSATSPSPRALSDATKIMLERRIGELRNEIAAALKRRNHAKADQLYRELSCHQVALGFTPDDPPPKPKAPRKEESLDSPASSDWPSPEEVEKTFNELRRSLGWPVKR